MAVIWISENAGLVSMIRAVQFTPGNCANFEMLGKPGRWMQFSGDKLNAYYPRSEHPQRLVDHLGAVLDEWAPMAYLTLHTPGSPGAIADWIMAYARTVLDGGPQPILCARLSRLRLESPSC